MTSVYRRNNQQDPFADHRRALIPREELERYRWAEAITRAANATSRENCEAMLKADLAQSRQQRVMLQEELREQKLTSIFKENARAVADNLTRDPYYL